MKALVATLLLSAVCVAQEPKGGRMAHKPAPSPDTYTVATPQGITVMTCNKLGDGYHCDIAPGHTLDEAMTVIITTGQNHL